MLCLYLDSGERVRVIDVFFAAATPVVKARVAKHAAVADAVVRQHVAVRRLASQLHESHATESRRRSHEASDTNQFYIEYL